MAMDSVLLPGAGEQEFPETISALPPALRPLESSLSTTGQ